MLANQMVVLNARQVVVVVLPHFALLGCSLLASSNLNRAEEAALSLVISLVSALHRGVYALGLQTIDFRESANTVATLAQNNNFLVLQALIVQNCLHAHVFVRVAQVVIQRLWPRQSE